MPENQYEFINAVQSQAQLTITLRIEGSQTSATLGADVEWLGKILFVTGVSEFVFEYVTYLLGVRAPVLYDPVILQEFGYLFGKARPYSRSWTDVFTEEGDFWVDEFRSQIRRRRGGYSAIGSGDVLRVTLESAWTENPRVRVILATGLASVMMILSGGFSATQMMKERNAVVCRQQQIDIARQQGEAILREAKLEGKLTPELERAYLKSLDVMNASIATCGATFRDVTITASPTPPKVTIHAGVALPPK
jgi:hypothetical protein